LGFKKIVSRMRL